MKQILSNFITLMKAAWHIEKRYFLYLFFNISGISIFSYYSIQIPKIVLDMIENKSIDFSYLAIVFLTLALSAFVVSMTKVFYMPVGSKIRYNYLLELSKQYMSIPYEVYENPSVQDNIWKISRPVSSIDGIQGFYTDLAQFVGNLGIFLIAIGLLFKLEIWIVILVLAWFIFYTYLSIRASNKIDKRINNRIHLLQEEWYLDDIAIDVAYGKEIRVFQLQNWMQTKLSVLYKKMNKLFRENENTRVLPNILDDTYQFLRDSLIYIFLIVLFFNNKMSIGELASYSVLISQLNRALMMGTDNLQRLLSKHENYKHMFDFINIPTQSNQGISIEEKEDWIIEFENVSFKYPDTEHWIYKDLNFTIKSKQKLAIVGLNGVGKTTLLKLLLRLYKPSIGAIKLNGINIDEYKLEDYFNLFAPVFQEINLFPFTIRDNISFGQDIDDDALISSFAKAGLDHKQFNKDTLDSVYLTRYLYSEGLMLSGGQAQKFVTARAIAFNRPIYIFDEPTSALDAVAEYDFYHQIESDMNDKTILFVSHRLASTQFCDEILLIEGQSILEKGSHESLLNQGGRYAELFNMQAKYYRNEEVL